MAVPDFQTLMLPLLEIYGDGKEHSINEAVDALSKKFSLTEQELTQFISSGKQTTIYNRISRQSTYLSKAGLLGNGPPFVISHFEAWQVGACGKTCQDRHALPSAFPRISRMEEKETGVHCPYRKISPGRGCPHP